MELLITLSVLIVSIIIALMIKKGLSFILKGSEDKMISQIKKEVKQWDVFASALIDDIDPPRATQCKVMFSGGRFSTIKSPSGSHSDSYKIEYWDVEISDNFDALYVAKGIHNWAQHRPKENK
ncbi:MAG: hypothetical protein ACI9MS_001264 [Glaciecola sp.]|jgi:hypothetical protein